jgi:hypothetical protein
VNELSCKRTQPLWVADDCSVAERHERRVPLLARSSLVERGRLYGAPRNIGELKEGSSADRLADRGRGLHRDLPSSDRAVDESSATSTAYR